MLSNMTVLQRFRSGGAVTGDQVLGDERILLAAGNEHALVPVRFNNDLGPTLHAAAAPTTAPAAPAAPTAAAKLRHSPAAAPAAIPSAKATSATSAAAERAASPATASVTCISTPQYVGEVVHNKPQEPGW